MILAAFVFAALRSLEEAARIEIALEAFPRRVSCLDMNDLAAVGVKRPCVASDFSFPFDGFRHGPESFGPSAVGLIDCHNRDNGKLTQSPIERKIFSIPERPSGGNATMYDLFTDGDCDVTPKIAAEYGYHVIAMPYIVDGKEIYPYLDWKEFRVREYYQALRKGLIPKTCGLSPKQYVDYFEPSFKAGHDILYVHFSSAMSGTFSAMRIALDQLRRKYPDRKYYDVDTKAVTVGALGMCQEIGRMHKEGASPEAIVAWAEREVQHFATYFYADNLKFFARSGRVSNFSAAMGGLVGVKPIIYMTAEGGLVSISKALGRLTALSKLLQYVEELQYRIKDHKVIIGHCDCLFLAERMAHMLRLRFGHDLPIEIVPVGPVAGAHCGPDCIAVNFYARHR